MEFLDKFASIIQSLGSLIRIIGNSQFSMSLVFTAFGTAATVIYVLLTRQLVVETRKLRELQTDPNILIYLQPSQNVFGFLDLVIRNIGFGTAYNVRFKIEKEFPVEGNVDRLPSKIEFLKEGFSHLPPNYEISSYFMKLMGKQGTLTGKEIIIKATYENSSGETRDGVFQLRLSQFEGIEKVGNPPIIRIAESLEQINTGLLAIANQFPHHNEVSSQSNTETE